MLIQLIDEKLTHSEVGGVFKIGTDYAKDSKTNILFIVMNKSFDPASIEFNMEN